MFNGENAVLYIGGRDVLLQLARMSATSTGNSSIAQKLANALRSKSTDPLYNDQDVKKTFTDLYHLEKKMLKAQRIERAFYFVSTPVCIVLWSSLALMQYIQIHTVRLAQLLQIIETTAAIGSLFGLAAAIMSFARIFGQRKQAERVNSASSLVVAEVLEDLVKLVESTVNATTVLSASDFHKGLQKILVDPNNLDLVMELASSSMTTKEVSDLLYSLKLNYDLGRAVNTQAAELRNKVLKLRKRNAAVGLALETASLVAVVELTTFQCLWSITQFCDPFKLARFHEAHGLTINASGLFDIIGICMLLAVQIVRFTVDVYKYREKATMDKYVDSLKALDFDDASSTGTSLVLVKDQKDILKKALGNDLGVSKTSLALSGLAMTAVAGILAGRALVALNFAQQFELGKILPVPGAESGFNFPAGDVPVGFVMRAVCMAVLFALTFINLSRDVGKSNEMEIDSVSSTLQVGSNIGV